MLVRFTPQVARSDAARLVSAIRAQLRGMAAIELDPGALSLACIVDVDRTESGIVLRFIDGMGGDAGAPRLVTRGGEIGASEGAAMVRAFVTAAVEKENEAENPAPGALAPTPHPEPSDAPPFAPPPACASEFTDRAPRAERAGAPARSRHPWRGRLAAFYTGATYAAELPWHSGARLEGSYSFVPGWYGGVTYAYHPNVEMPTEAASVRVTRSAGAVFAGVESNGLVGAFGADASAGIEHVTRASSVLKGGGARIVPLFAMRLHGRWRLPYGRGAAIDVAPTIELALGQEALFVESKDTATRSVPAVARFRLDVGVTFDLF
ncbi:hypothetical protein LVJ94_51580 [Pendulispora rubella]|uniref:Uncharacterized protein n=1 Tax=Pendulispora rubella TaxID=2741070 RepID=A0ABZ2L3A7_9BACT